jgi:hypothetical protein
MIGAAGADPGRLEVRSHVYLVWEDSRHTRMEDTSCGIDMKYRDTQHRQKGWVTLQKAVAIRNG